MTRCADCDTERDHCHGTLIEHADGGVECTDDCCVMPYPVRHEMVVDCGVFAGCGCDQPVMAALGQRSSA